MPDYSTPITQRADQQRFQHLPAPAARALGAISALASASSPLNSGTNFYTDCALHLAESYQTQYAVIGVYTSEHQDCIQTIAVVVDGQVVDNYLRPLAGSPCRDVLVHEHVFVADHASVVYPKDSMLTQLNIRSYFGAHLLDSQKNQLGLVLVADVNPMVKDPWIDPVLGLYADRIAMELEKESAQHELQLAASVFDGSNQAIFITDAKHNICKVNNAFLKVTGWSEADVCQQPREFLLADKQPQTFYTDIVEHLLNSDTWHGEVWGKRKNGEVYPEARTIIAVRNHAGELQHCVNIFSDVSAEKFAEQRIQRLAYYDTATDLPNRVLFQEQLSKALSSRKKTGSVLAVFFIDLDGFKLINDTYGHARGDVLLRSVADRLSGNLKNVDILARIGGDEFAVMLSSARDVESVSKVAKRILDIIIEPYKLEGDLCTVSASIGISFYPEDARDAQSLLQHADTAMYRAKREGKNCFVFFKSEMVQHAQQRLRTTEQLRLAIEEQQFELYYQPQFSIPSKKLCGFEALLRWNISSDQQILPADFIRLAEQTGLIVPIGRWVIYDACATAARWLEQGLSFGRMSVNLSGRQFNGTEVYDTVRDALTQSQLPPQYLALEITETWLMEGFTEVIPQLESLNALGVELAIDDFGIAYSSMHYLKKFPVSKIKIDQSFVRDIPEDKNDAAITSAIIAMGHSLGLEVIAEGVESQGQADFLISSGCDEVQGLLYSKPLSVSEASHFLLDNKS